MAERDARAIFVVSDGTGRTCKHVLLAALVQYPNEDVNLVTRPDIRTAKKATAVVDEAAEADAVIFFSLVADETRQAIKKAAKERLVPFVDVLGQTLSALHTLFSQTHDMQPGLLYTKQKEYFDRVDAIDYTLKHDDGQRLDELDKANVVLVGVSRASKSSTCFYLAYRGVRAANVPLFHDREPPQELLDLDPNKVIGLTVNAHRLQSIREARLHILGAKDIDYYYDPRTVARELRAAIALMNGRGWRTIDVSYKAIEEVASEIISMIGVS
ncbi:MAG: kinase/pyrophosphorylase [Phycisphaerales bacterium]|nr:kinase/pyrophosphorylase [Phycisphaerales bacterium]